jgi:hypothetical protein
MQQWPACLAAIAFLVFGCASPERAPPAALPPLFPAPAATSSGVDSAAPAVRDGIVFPDIPSEAASRLSTVSPLPPRPPLYLLTPPSVSAPVGAATNLGPITGYGPGGMGHVPGSPPNPPYN